MFLPRLSSVFALQSLAEMLRLRVELQVEINLDNTQLVS